MMTLAPFRPVDRITINADGTLTGRARAVPFATDAAHMAVLAHGPNGARHRSGRLPSRAHRRGPHPGWRCAVRCRFRSRQAALQVAAAPAGLDQTALLLMGCAVRAVETAGALEAMLGMAVRYANERVAFERPIAKFQAVQHNLARLAGEVSAAMIASGSAADAIARGRDLRRGAVSRGGGGQDPRLGSRAGRLRHRPSGARRHRLHARSTSCTAIRCACSAGATTSATRATGPWSWAAREAAPTTLAARPRAWSLCRHRLTLRCHPRACPRTHRRTLDGGDLRPRM